MSPRGGRKTCGFTLMEMLLSMSLMAVLMLAAAFAIYAAEGSHAYNSEKNNLLTCARGVTDRLSLDIRRCTSFTVNSTTNVAVLLPNGATNTYYYSAAGGGTVLYTQTVAGVTTTPAVLTSYVQSFTVANDAPSCRIQIVLQGTYSQYQITATATPGKALF